MTSIPSLKLSESPFSTEKQDIKAQRNIYDCYRMHDRAQNSGQGATAPLTCLRPSGLPPPPYFDLLDNLA